MPMLLVLIIVCERDAFKSLRSRFVLMAWRDVLVRWWMIWWRDHKPIRWALKQCYESWTINGSCCCFRRLCRYLQFNSAAMVVKSSRCLVDDGTPFVLAASHWMTTVTTVCGAHCVDNKWSEITRERMAMFSWLLLIWEINLFPWMGSLAGGSLSPSVGWLVKFVCAMPGLVWWFRAGESSTEE